MEAQNKNKLPQEGTTDSGKSLTEQSSVCPSYSGGDILCSGPASKLDLSSLAEAINVSSEDTPSGSQWTVVAHKRPCKKGNANPKTTTIEQGQPERSRRNRRARREALRPNNGAETATAAAETQREPVPSAPKGAAATQEASSPKPGTSAQPTPPPAHQQNSRRKPRGSRGRRTAATAPTGPEKDQPGKGDGPSGRASSKRGRLDETQSPRGDAKRAKTDAKLRRTVCYADAAQSHLRVAVITVPPRDLSEAQAEQLRKSIDDRILQAALSPPSPSTPAPSFRGRPFPLDGALAMWCEDANALSWLEKALKNMTSPIPGTTLDVIKQNDMKKKLKAGLLLHTSITDSSTLHKVLCAQNPWYKVDTWQCYDMTADAKQPGAESSESVVHLVLGIPEDQKQVIMDRDRRVAFMSGSGYIRFFSGEADKAAHKSSVTEAEGKVPNTAPSTSAPGNGPSEMATDPPLIRGGDTSDEDDVLRSP